MDPNGARVANSDSPLYWSTLSSFENCPQYILWSKGWDTIDLGYGMGKKKPKPVKDSKEHAVMGIVIAAVSEELYNSELYKHPAGLQERLLALTEQKFKYEIEHNYIDWRTAPPKADLLKICKDGVVGFLKTMKHNRFLAPYSKAEVDLLGWVDKWNPVGGRPDLILRQEDGTGVTILDGKNSKEKGKYTDPDQLRWYALLYYLAYGVMPERLGFLYYRYPAGKETVNDKGEIITETGVDWVSCTREDIKGLAHRAVEAKKAMRKEKFAANPTPKGCQFCDYQTVCPERIAQKAANSRNRKPKEDILATGTAVEGAPSGFMDLDFK